MELLKTLILNRFKILSILTISMAFSIIILMIRIKFHHSFYLLFLVWNLFLAIIPFAITTTLISKSKLHKIKFTISFGVWLLFLPNAPYIITDLLHINNSPQHLLWLDVLVIISFAFNGLILFMLSLSDMEKLLKLHIKPKFVFPMMLLIFGLTAFGIYLGRFLRYNSWEILNNPLSLFSDIFQLIFEPHFEAWVFTLTFASFLAMTYYMLKAFSNSKI
ncbi:DUF1361 domain-containing protein [Psychroserpens ponticola]|uniref:DUF1361 domain-containing protein n=1 Tax=Psychroserpens ponticola TaxID=2932268 RepID=A0ABY7RV56_9FLAO|nr:DUF1361 domain-containing protein [Psychroserpens ponticola]WCO00858.1 DUF1361 domain-containing protein [Psychroserpens ponticola]